MKLFAIFLCIAFAALAAGEAHWDESGQYRLVDTAPAPIYYASKARAIQYVAPLRYYAPMKMPLTEYKPFVYSYKQINV